MSLQIRNSVVIGALAALTLLMLPAKMFADPIHKAPELIGTTSDWLNTNGKALHLYGPGGLLTPGADGKSHHIVLIDFWEYTCVNCIRTLPYIKGWDAKYRADGLVIVGIHSPEFAFAQKGLNVQTATSRLGIKYPVVNDKDYLNWQAWKNDSWPREILIDSDGTVIEDHEGEGQYAETESKIRAALQRLHPGALGGPVVTQADTDFMDRTPEMYCGYERGVSNYANKGGIKQDKTVLYRGRALSAKDDGHIVLSGTWKVTDESVQHIGRSASDSLAIRYHGPDCNAVIKPEAGKPCDVILLQDGRPIKKADAGSDVRYDAAGRSYIHVDQPRMYSLTRLANPGAHDLLMRPKSEGFGLYSFAF